MSWFDRVRRRFAPNGDLAPASDLDRAIALFEDGRVEEAEVACAGILANAPANAQALHLLGLAADRRGAHARAVDLLQSALTASPDNGLFHLNLGNALRALGRDSSANGHAR